MCHIRIFPNSQGEFETQAQLSAWLMTTLRANGGKYRITTQSEQSNHRPAELPTGSIVLFRFNKLIIGEAVVLKYSNEPAKDEEDGVDFLARVFFVPSSIRIFSPAIPIKVLDDLEEVPQNLSGANPYYRLVNWIVYPKMLAAHITGGFRNNGGIREGIFL
jgi:hypothetical protein